MFPGAVEPYPTVIVGWVAEPADRLPLNEAIDALGPGIGDAGGDERLGCRPKTASWAVRPGHLLTVIVDLPMMLLAAPHVLPSASCITTP